MITRSLRSLLGVGSLQSRVTGLERQLGLPVQKVASATGQTPFRVEAKDADIHRFDERRFEARPTPMFSRFSITPDEQYPHTILSLETPRGPLKERLQYGHLALAALITDYDFTRVLDIGSASGTTARAFELLGKDVTTMEIPSEDEGSYLDTAFPEPFDAIWCSHVLERQRNVGRFLEKTHSDLREGGVLAITVPSALSPLIIGHCNIFTPLHLIYNLILAGYDCREARIKCYDWQFSVLLQKKSNGLPSISFATTHFPSAKGVRDIGYEPKLLEWFPIPVPGDGHVWGEFESVNWHSPSVAPPTPPATSDTHQPPEHRVKSKVAQAFAVPGHLARLAGRLDAIEHDLKMPKYLYHSPLDYSTESHTPTYAKAIMLAGEPLPIPPPECRPGYSPHDDQLYLEWGRSDHDVIVDVIKRHYGLRTGLDILDFGCSSGRVLRHFYSELKERSWKLHGIDIQAFLIEWMRRNFPIEINVLCGSTLPHLPFRDSSLDVIYGISVFTHTKYLWDMWLAEFKRVLKPGGLCMQTVQCEAAWRFYHENRNLDWVKQAHPWSMLEKSEMDEDFFFYGDAFISQDFYREEAVKRYWGRYMRVVEFLPPPRFSYHNWIVLENSV